MILATFSSFAISSRWSVCRLKACQLDGSAAALSIAGESGEREPALWPAAAHIGHEIQQESGEREPALWPSAAHIGQEIQLNPD